MIESSSFLPEQEQARQVIADKQWYRMTNGVFSWEDSTQALAQTLGLGAGWVRKAFAQGFTPESLVRVPDMHPNAQPTDTVPFLYALTQLCTDVHLWTVGDPVWQEYKCIQSGAALLLGKPENLHIFSDHKEAILPQIVHRQQHLKQSLVFIDDKQKNLDRVYALSRELPDDQLVLHTYHLKLHDPQANARLCAQHIKSLIAGNPDTHIRLYVDFDGVVVDTDGVMQGPVAHKLAHYMRIAKR